MFVADSLWLLLPAMYLNGAAYAFRSGAQQAFLFDSLEDEPTGSRFTHLLGKLNAVSYVAIAATTALGASLAERDYAWPFGLAIGAGLAAAWLAAGLREPASEPETRRGMAGAVIAALRIVRGNRRLLALIVFTAALWTVSALVHLYAQAVLTERGLPTSRIGLVFGVVLVGTACGAWLGRPVGALAVLRLLDRCRHDRHRGVGSAAGRRAAPCGRAGSDRRRARSRSLRADGRAARQRRHHLRAAGDRPLGRGFLFSVTMVWAFPLFGWTAERWGWLPPTPPRRSGRLLLAAIFCSWAEPSALPARPLLT